MQRWLLTLPKSRYKIDSCLRNEFEAYGLTRLDFDAAQGICLRVRKRGPGAFVEDASHAINRKEYRMDLVPNSGDVGHRVFRDRSQAAHALALPLRAYQGQNPLVIGIARGAVAMAKIIADDLHGEFDLILVQKLRAPQQPELAIGAVDEGGHTYLSDLVSAYTAGLDYVAEEKTQRLKILEQQRAQYSRVRSPRDPRGRIVIVVDDGLATGATMTVALQSLRTRGPASLICAVPVAPPDTLQKIAVLADQVVYLVLARHFQAVGQFYTHFPQVEDDEVIALLQSA